ncbi:MAG: hypothetical protein KR126chlam6_00158 [Candidatus Anoxychlamydiales bacterium]|nr:hypothetical protein [Candidatus Anoxychlamydiales bacterium]
MNVETKFIKTSDKIEFNPFEIEPIFPYPINYRANFDSFMSSIHALLKSILSENTLLELHKAKDREDIRNVFLKMEDSLPLITNSSFATATPFCFAFSVFCTSDLTNEISRFITDKLTRWLVPGKLLDINGHRSIRFKFKHFDQKSYYLSEYFITIGSEKELLILKKNLTFFINEMKLIIMSVKHTKDINSLNELRDEKQSSNIEQNISSLVMKNRNEINDFDQRENIFFKLSEEKKINEIKENLALLMYKRPKIFDRDIFDSLHNTSLIFKEKFTTTRDPKLVSRIIALQYLFKKSIKQISSHLPQNKRIVKIKLLKTNSKKSVLGILIVMNILKENEYFEKSYILEAISQIIKNFKFDESSYIVDHREDKILSFYLEIESQKSRFSIEEINDLKQRLPEAFTSKMKNLMNPIFLPRNEEEILRNIIVLTKQLNYVKDIPQVMISFSKQTSKDISFTVILLRLIKKNEKSLKELFTYSNTFLKFSLEEAKTVGMLKKKYPKEANIFRVSMNKYPFLRRDYSLDLRKGRQTLCLELTNVIGKFRDFNGGLLIKQCEALESLKKMLSNLKKSYEFLLEEFFYSIRPGIMQSILDATVFKKFFLMFIDITKKPLDKNEYTINSSEDGKYYFVMIKTNVSQLKDNIILAVNKLKFKSFEIISSSLDKNDQKTLGYILLSSLEKKKNRLLEAINSAVEKQ